jgi:hypothetical protein
MLKLCPLMVAILDQQGSRWASPMSPFAIFNFIWRQNTALGDFFGDNILFINQRLSRACIVHLVIKKTNWSYVKTMSCVILELRST